MELDRRVGPAGEKGAGAAEVGRPLRLARDPNGRQNHLPASRPEGGEGLRDLRSGRHTADGGQSIGVGLGHLDQFAWVGAFSAAVSGNDPVLAALRSDPGAANQKLKLLWIAIGKDDFLLARNRDFVKALDELKVRHTSQETERTHACGVWRGYLAEFLPLLFR